MVYMKKSALLVAVLTTVLGGMLLSHANAARPESGNGMTCVMDVVVESRNQTGVLIGTETYHKEFSLLEGEAFSEDFSTRTRFKFFDASLTKLNGEKTVAIDWFADVTVFNSVDFRTSVVLSNGDKDGQSAGEHTLYTSSGSTTTSYSLSCVEN